ncbi:RBBP9/YdeN family alpha/beta hydrolase [Antribacter gilvus]|uniref:RBBP9/YdeN family alpha/beta hydrolase n=1 Tax=Antribacter gilvus TaxID=2304675 RepID=UPI000F7A32A5|nr:alpha/beta fold hydrolase [Antribacter gilvus]
MNPTARRTVILFHGTGAHPDALWYPWLARRLRERGYAVEVPHHPGINIEPIATFLPKVLEAHAFGPDTILVGHSGGAALLLAVLEHLDVTVAQAVLVAGYSTRPGEDDEPVLQDSYDWATIRAHARDLVFINSVTDRYGCDAIQGRTMFDHLGGTLVIRDDDHFEGERWDLTEFDLLDRLIS